MIQDLSYFIWREPIKIDLAKRDRSIKCVYHKDHGHTIEQCRSLDYTVERLVRVRNLKQYIHSEGRHGDTTQNPAVQVLTTLAALKVIINYIHGRLVDEKYNSKWKKQRLL